MKLSIVIPTYNQDTFIEDAINSVLKQSDCEIELIIFDALSTDRTAEIVEKYKGRLTWKREADHGQVDAILQGFKESSGDIIAWLNSDDAYLPGIFTRVVNIFKSDPDLQFIYGDALDIDSRGNILGPNLFTENSVPHRYLYSHNYIVQPTMFLRRTVLNAIAPMREDLLWTMDYEWFGRMYLAGLKGHRLPAFIATNRDYAHTKTNTGGFARYREMLRVHASRSGPVFLTRRAVRIYTLEFIIKIFRNKKYSIQCLENLRQRFITCLDKIFLKTVAPRRENEIIKNYQAEILPRGPTLNEQWDNYSEF